MAKQIIQDLKFICCPSQWIKRSHKAMNDYDTFIRQIKQNSLFQVEQKLRAFLSTQDKEWLINQIVHLTLQMHDLLDVPLKLSWEQSPSNMNIIVKRLCDLSLDREKLVEFLQSYERYDRAELINQGYLLPKAPVKGTGLINENDRSEKGNRLLLFAKDLLMG